MNLVTLENSRVTQQDKGLLVPDNLLKTSRSLQFFSVGDLHGEAVKWIKLQKSKII